MDENKETKSIPKYVFDKEYSTQWRREVQFLEEKGINYTYGKKHYKYPIIRYKYTKTPELFLALAEFYNQVRNERFFRQAENANKTIEALSEKLPVEKGYIEVKKEDLTEAEQKTVAGIETEVRTLIEDDTE